MRYLMAEARIETKMIQASNSENYLQWIQLFGQLCVRQPVRTITRFRTKKAAELLAYLACYRHRQHAREALIEMLWPEEEIEAARNRLSVELNSLRRQLEPPGVPAGAVLRADRTSVQLNPDACMTDVAEFEAALQAVGQTQDDAEQASLLTQAIDLYVGELLPGHYTEWVLTERERLADAYFSALRLLIGCLARLRQFERALDYARRAVHVDPLREASYRDLMRLYSAVGRPSAALDLYQDLERLLQESLGAAPSMATQELAAQIQAQAGAEVKTVRAPAAKAPTLALPSTDVVAIEPAGETERLDRSSPTRTGSLPLQFTRFFGRKAEMTSLEALLSEAEIRLITLSGPGGSGKTRLSIEVGRSLREQFPGGVWFVPLADLWDPRLIAKAIRDTLGLSRSPNRDPLEQAVEALSAQPALLILDNFEQVAAGGAPVVRTLLKRVENLRCLVSSRRRLNLAGEREFPVPALPLPLSAESPQQLLRTASVLLFVDRAQAVRPDFQITAGNAPDVARLCVDLEGIPLAIELAAARAKALTPAQIRERLSERFALLATRRMDKGSRHRSLWAAIDWSYHQLSPGLQQFFARLSIFRGGWTLEAAEAVCEEALALDYLAQLQGHSLVSAEESPFELRFRMLESLREYAQEQLTEDERQEVAGRHVDFYVPLVEQAQPALLGPEQIRWLDRLEQEHDNLRAALERCMTEPESIRQGLRLAATLWPFWDTRGFLTEGRDWLTRMLAATSAQCETKARAQALNAAGVLATSQGDFAAARLLLEEGRELYRTLDDPRGMAALLGNLASTLAWQGERASAYALARESLALLREVQDRSGIALTLSNLGSMARRQGDFETARAFLEESLALRRELGDTSGIAHALSNLGNIAYHQADYATAHAVQEQCLALRRRLGDPKGIADTLGDLGIIALDQGCYEDARVLQEESLTIRREIGDKAGMALALGNLGTIAISRGDYRSAHSLQEESLAIRRQLGDRAGVALSLANLGELAEAEGDYTTARDLYEQSQALYRQLNDSATLAAVLTRLGRTLRAFGKLADARDCLVESIRLAQETGSQRTIAEALEGFALLAAADKRYERASRLYGAADRLCESLGAPRPTSTKDLAKLRAALPESAFSTAWEEGRDMAQEQALVEALEGDSV